MGSNAVCESISTDYGRWFSDAPPQEMQQALTSTAANNDAEAPADSNGEPCLVAPYSSPWNENAAKPAAQAALVNATTSKQPVAEQQLAGLPFGTPGDTSMMAMGAVALRQPVARVAIATSEQILGTLTRLPTAVVANTNVVAEVASGASRAAPSVVEAIAGVATKLPWPALVALAVPGALIAGMYYTRNEHLEPPHPGEPIDGAGGGGAGGMGGGAQAPIISDLEPATPTPWVAQPNTPNTPLGPADGATIYNGVLIPGAAVPSEDANTAVIEHPVPQRTTQIPPLEPTTLPDAEHNQNAASNPQSTPWAPPNLSPAAAPGYPPSPNTPPSSDGSTRVSDNTPRLSSNDDKESTEDSVGDGGRHEAKDKSDEPGWRTWLRKTVGWPVSASTGQPGDGASPRTQRSEPAQLAGAAQQSGTPTVQKTVNQETSRAELGKSIQELRTRHAGMQLLRQRQMKAELAPLQTKLDEENKWIAGFEEMLESARNDEDSDISTDEITKFEDVYAFQVRVRDMGQARIDVLKMRDQIGLRLDYVTAIKDLIDSKGPAVVLTRLREIADAEMPQLFKLFADTQTAAAETTAAAKARGNDIKPTLAALENENQLVRTLDTALQAHYERIEAVLNEFLNPRVVN